MTTSLFTLLLTVFSVVGAFLTEGIKKVYQNKGKEYSANIIALINGIVVGCGGTAAVYALFGIAFTLPNIVCLILMGGAVWLGSMLGYDKVKQLVEQVKVIMNK